MRKLLLVAGLVAIVGAAMSIPPPLTEREASVQLAEPLALEVANVPILDYVIMQAVSLRDEVATSRTEARTTCAVPETDNGTIANTVHRSRYAAHMRGWGFL